MLALEGFLEASLDFSVTVLEELSLGSDLLDCSGLLSWSFFCTTIFSGLLKGTVVGSRKDFGSCW